MPTMMGNTKIEISKWVFLMAFLHLACTAQGERLSQKTLVGCVSQNIEIPCPNVSGKPGDIFWKFLVNGSFENLAAMEDSGTKHYPIKPRQFLGRVTIFPNGSLVVNNLSLTDSGSFMCYWRGPDDEGRSPNTTHTELLVKPCDEKVPKITESPKRVIVVQGHPLYLYCEASGVPDPYISWSKDNEVLQNRTKKTSYIRHEAVKSDAGFYVCQASNVVGFDRITVEVNVKTENETAGVINGDSTTSTGREVALIVLFAVAAVVAFAFCGGAFLLHRHYKYRRERNRPDDSPNNNFPLEEMRHEDGTNTTSDLAQGQTDEPPTSRP